MFFIFLSLKHAKLCKICPVSNTKGGCKDNHTIITYIRIPTLLRGCQLLHYFLGGILKCHFVSVSLDS